MARLRRLADSSPSCPPLLSRLQSMAFQMRNYMSKEEGEGAGLSGSNSTSSIIRGSFDPSTWRTFDSRTIGLNRSAITWQTRKVLEILRQKGYEAYLVGGCVRDLLLKRVPKDFDVITTASLNQIRKQFRNCRIIGSRFPICQVHIRGSIIEVSSFNTNVKGRQEVDCSEMSYSCNNYDILRWRNSMSRDFTINGLFFDPSNCKIYDYVNGLRDIRKNKVCTVIPAHVSFKEDCARILRGLRIVARLGFRFSKETSDAIKDSFSSIMDLDKARLMMELNFMLAYGAAESSIWLLQKYRLLDIFLPFHAAYLSDQTKDNPTNRKIMLMKLFSNLDKLLAADRPCHCTLWLGLLAFHMTLVNYPQNALVVWAFSAVLYFGSWRKAMKFLKQNIRGCTQFIPEIPEYSGTKSDAILMEETSNLASLVKSSVDSLTKLDALQQSLVRYPETSQLGLVFVSKKEATNVSRLFSGIAFDITNYNGSRGRDVIDYKLLKDGDPNEVQFVIGRVIMDTINDELACTASSCRPTQEVGASRPKAQGDADEERVPLSTLFQ